MSNGDKKRIEIRDRDLAILRTLFECRVMTRLQAADDPLGAIWLCPVTYRTSADRSLLNSNVESHPFRADFKNNGFGG